MSSPHFDLNRLDGLYPGFEHDRDTLRERFPKLDVMFRRACEELAGSDDWTDRPPREIAHRVMRMLTTNYLAAKKA